LPPEQLATADLAAFFPGAQAATAPPAPVNGDESDPIVADINRMIHSDDEDDEDDDEGQEDKLDEVDAAPSGNGANGMSRPTEAKPRPSPNEEIGRARKHTPRPAERRPKNGMERARPKNHGSPPSTNGDPPTDRGGGNGPGRRRCA
jgi:hypothetical protein